MTQITFNPNPVVSPMRLAQRHRVWLAHIDMDVAHIVNPFEYLMYVHEVGHLILRSVPGWRRYLGTASDAVTDAGGISRDRRYGVENLDEIAVDMLTYLLVFSPDVELFRKYLIVRFNSHPAFSGLTAEHALVRFAELLVRVFFVTDPFVQAGGADGSGPKYTPDPEEAYARFRKMVQSIGPFFREYVDCSRDESDAARYESYLRKVFNNLFPRYRQSVARMLWYVRTVLREAMTIRAYPWHPPEAAERQRGELDGAIRVAIEGGRPFVRGAYSSDRALTDRMDEFFIANRVLRAYVASTLAGLRTEGGSIHADRSGDRHLIRLDTARRWNHVLLDPLRPGFCASIRRSASGRCAARSRSSRRCGISPPTSEHAGSC